MVSYDGDTFINEISGEEVLILIVVDNGLVQAWLQGVAKHFNES